MSFRQYQQNQDSEYEQSNVQAFNLQQQSTDRLHCKQKMSVPNPKMLFSSSYEHNFFGTTFPGTQEFFNGKAESNQSFQLIDAEEERKNTSKHGQRKEHPIRNSRPVKKLSTSINNKTKWSQCVKGNRFETKNICKHLFTETAKFLKLVAKIHEFTTEEKERVETFLSKKGKINLSGFAQLFMSRQLRKKCLAFYESNHLVSNIMRSKADIKSKLTFLKYLEKIRTIPLNIAIKSWKK